MTLPSACWPFSSRATTVRPTASPLPLSVATRRGLAACPGRDRICARRGLNSPHVAQALISRCAVVQPQLLQRGLRVAHQLLEGGLRILGLLEAHQLHLVELVLADEALRVLAVASRLGAEAGGERAVLEREARALED